MGKLDTKINHVPHLAIRKYKWHKHWWQYSLVIHYYCHRMSEWRDIGVLRDGLGRKISIKHLWREDMYDKEN